MRRLSDWVVTAGALAALLTSCMRASAPPGWLPHVEEVGSDPYGAWAEVSYSIHRHRLDVRGELVTIERDSLFVLSDSTLVGVPFAARPVAHIWVYEGGTMVASASYARLPFTSIQSEDFERLRPYARFPEGFPPGLDRVTLRPRVRGR
jgi:hypothetical protein